MKSLPSLSVNSPISSKSKKFNQKVKKFNLKVKATILGMAIGVIPVILIGSVTYLLAENSVDRKIKQFKMIEATSMIDKAEQFIKERYNNIEALSKSSIFKDQRLRQRIDRESKSQKLTKYLEIYGVYDSIAAIDLNGNNIATSKGKTILNHKDQDYFQEVLNRRSRFISQPRRDPVTGETVIYFSAPVRDSQNNTIVAIIVSRMPVVHLKKLLEEYGTNGSTYHLIDRSGKIFVSNKQESATRADEHLPSFEELRQAKKPDFFKLYEQVESRKVLGGYAPFNNSQIIKDLGWDGFLVTDIEIAYADLNRLFFTIVVGTFSIAVLTGTISAILANRTIRPITEAAIAVEKIGRGDLDARLQVQGYDELAILGTNINSMADQIQILLREVKDKATELKSQNDRIAKESELLQEDISEILDLVCALESGDLTKEGKVSPRITGLIADTLNRLTEKLNRTISTVLLTAQQVNRKAEEVEQGAIANTEQVQQQTLLVTEVQELMVNVNNLSQTAAEQAFVADETIQQVGKAVNLGHLELNNINSATATLAEGTEQIVKKTDTIKDFIELAARFTKENKILAAQTRVLALNTSMLASRAAKEQESSLAKEFETIAKQVNDLALKTDRNLILLKQRSESIQTVGSGLDRDIQEIAQLVNEFTHGVSSSHQAFEDINIATQKLGTIGQKVTKSSWDIAEAVQITLDTVAEITAVAAKTEQKITITRSESSSMEEMASNLLELIHFFKLSAKDEEQKIDPQIAKSK